MNRESVNFTVENDDQEQRKWLFREVTAQAKALIGREATARLAAYDLANRLVDHVAQARKEIGEARYAKGFEREAPDSEIAKWLNTRGHLPKRGAEWSRTNISKTLFRAPERMIEHAVLECRTRMTVLALSADFTKPIEAVRDLEREYLVIIAKALAIGHRLEGRRERGEEELMQDALNAAQLVAHRQRQSKIVGMAERERLWRDFAPIGRKVFEREP